MRHALNPTLVPLEVVDWLSVLGVPQPHGFVIGCGCDLLSVGAKSHASNVVLVALEDVDQFSVLGVP